MLCYTITASLSGPCDDFINFVKSIKGDVDAGIGPHTKITFRQFVSVARNKRLDIVSAKEYHKLDSRKHELMTLTTKIGSGGAQRAEDGPAYFKRWQW